VQLLEGERRVSGWRCAGRAANTALKSRVLRREIDFAAERRIHRTNSGGRVKKIAEKKDCWEGGKKIRMEQRGRRGVNTQVSIHTGKKKGQKYFVSEGNAQQALKDRPSTWGKRKGTMLFFSDGEKRGEDPYTDRLSRRPWKNGTFGRLQKQ